MQDMKQIPMHKRPNVGVGTMDEFLNGGLCVESKEVNGVLMYVPYGIWCELFHVMDECSIMLAKKVDSLKELVKETENSNIENKQYLVDSINYQIEYIQKRIDFIQAVTPISTEV